MTQIAVVVVVPVDPVGISLPARMTLFGIYPQVHRYSYRMTLVEATKALKRITR
jgi:hypothetical protein